VNTGGRGDSVLRICFLKPSLDAIESLQRIFVIAFTRRGFAAGSR